VLHNQTDTEFRRAVDHDILTAHERHVRRSHRDAEVLLGEHFDVGAIVDDVLPMHPVIVRGAHAQKLVGRVHLVRVHLLDGHPNLLAQD